MKKLLLFSVFYFFAYFGFGQVPMLDQGNFLLGTTVGFSTADSKITLTSTDTDLEEEGHSARQFSISPKIGYFLLDNFNLGIGMDYTFSTVEEPNFDRTLDSDLLFGPFARYYFPIANDMAVFGEVNAGFGNSADEQQIAGMKQNINTNIFALGIGPGFTIFSDNGVGIEALFKYNYARSKFDTNLNGVKTTRTTQTNQFDISLGIQFYFGGLQRYGG